MKILTHSASCALVLAAGCAGSPKGASSAPTCDAEPARPFVAGGAEERNLAELPAPGPGAAPRPVRSWGNASYSCDWTPAGDVICGGIGPEREVPELRGAKDVAITADFTCALRASGDVECYGRCAPAHAVVATGVVELRQAPHDRPRACARTSAGAVVCFGDPAHGALGGAATRRTDLPMSVAIPFASGVDELALGVGFGCGRVGAEVHCFAPTDDPRAGPTRVGGLGTVVRVAAAGATFCALDGAGTITCADAPAFTPTRVALPGAVEVAIGSGHACARTRDGAVYCWGSGVLGDGDPYKTSAAPVRVVGIDDAVSIAAQPSVSCAVRRSGEQLCWGQWYGGGCVPREAWKPEVQPR